MTLQKLSKNHLFCLIAPNILLSKRAFGCVDTNSVSYIDILAAKISKQTLCFIVVDTYICDMMTPCTYFMNNKCYMGLVCSILYIKI